MVFAREMTYSSPLPQSVLDQRKWWQLQFVLLGVTFALRLIGADFAGALLSAVMLSVSIVMTRDGMAELRKYSLAYGVLSLMNFIFDLLLLSYAVTGRTDTEVPEFPADDGSSESFGVTATTYPFIDFSRGPRPHRS
eukprot:TRINITY_DN22890_c0_g1_i2.p1 TRINITY_DN22890_c0_g1~~TRINITY_DN22890_c0_g1_i2.p1  ORF type:complete len:137 (-),score=15.31 TRINITY_DN22890_c0_g1_i2:180-590(-)